VGTGGDSLPLKGDVDRIRIAHSKHLFDVRIACSVNNVTVWKAIANPRSANGVDSFLAEVQAQKYGKRETPYAQSGFGFFAFAVSSSFVFGPSLLPDRIFARLFLPT
jgi:hypothetical protein